MLRGQQCQHRKSKYPSVHLGSLTTLAKLDQKDDIYANIFNQIDTDKNGMIDKDEFRDATKALNLSLSEKELSEIYESISNNHQITLKSFRKFIQNSVQIHKQFAKFRKEFTAEIINKTLHINSDEASILIESPTYASSFTQIKLTELHQIAISLPLLPDKHKKDCFIGHSRIISHNNNNNNNGYISSDEMQPDLQIEQERNNILNLIPYSQIIKINDIYCEESGYQNIIDILNQTALPQTIIFRKTFGIAVDKALDLDHNTSDNADIRVMDDDDDDLSYSTEYEMSASIADSDKYVVHSSPSPRAHVNKTTHCKYCPHPSNHSWLLAIHRTFEDETYSKLSFAIITYIMICIIVSTITYVIETLPAVQQNPTAVQNFAYIEWIVSISFTVEYVIRIIACRNRFKYFKDTMNLIDFLAVIPFWIELLSGKAGANILRVIRVVRLARVIRLMKSDRFIEYMNVFSATIRRSSESFGLLSTLILLQIILFGSLFYVIEAGSNPLFSSIPMGSFYTVVTITTVGYGDMLPVTVLGRVVAVICMFLGLLIVALPVIIIGTNFEDEYRTYMNQKASKAISDKAKLIDQPNSSKIIKLSQADREFREVYNFLTKINAKFESEIFLPDDAYIMVNEGLCSEQRLLELLYNEKGYAFYPSKIQKSKIFVLHELYGQKKRELINDRT